MEIKDKKLGEITIEIFQKGDGFDVSNKISIPSVDGAMALALIDTLATIITLITTKLTKGTHVDSPDPKG